MDYNPATTPGEFATLILTYDWESYDWRAGVYSLEVFTNYDTTTMNALHSFSIAEPGVGRNLEVYLDAKTLLVGETTRIYVLGRDLVNMFPLDPESDVARFSNLYEITALSPGTYEFIVELLPTGIYPLEYEVVTIRVGSKPVEDFVQRYYRYILGREADQEGLNHWTKLLKADTATASEIADFFLSSDEFIGQNNNNSVYLDRLYQSFFDREADATGKRYWLNELNAGVTRRWVTASFINSEEFRVVCEEYGIERGNLELTSYADQNGNLAKYVTRCYREIHGREADPSGYHGVKTCFRSVFCGGSS